MENTALKGLDVERVSAWLAEALPALVPPFQYTLIAAGGSNLTYRVSDATGQQCALRRPPVRGQLATAHDMSREWRIMSALGAHPCGVPVPAGLAYCDDVAVTGAPFYVMDFVEGRILRDRAGAEALDDGGKLAATESLVAVQVAMHTADLGQLGLADLGKHTGYVARQLQRWHTQVSTAAVRPLPLMDELFQRLQQRVPTEQGRPGLVHGDYRFDNVILDERCQVNAVLDWELCTIGEPVADFCWSLQYWAEPGETLTFLQDPPTRAPGFMTRDQVAALYAVQSGFDLSDREYYFAFGYWKMACIVEGVYARLLKGAGGGMKTGPLDQVASLVERYLDAADALVR